MVARAYSCPRKYREGWKTLIQQHLAAGRIRPSNSDYVSPAFIVPKSDPTVLPRWVNDYRKLNANTVADNHPLPLVNDILRDCAGHQFYGKIDMTNSFFQTKMHPDSIKYTAVNTPFGLYEWLVMPMGLRNSPAVHQRRVFSTLRSLIGKICHVYLNDIIIWSNSLEQHEENICLVLEALWTANLYCSVKKSTLFCRKVDWGTTSLNVGSNWTQRKLIALSIGRFPSPLQMSARSWVSFDMSRISYPSWPTTPASSLPSLIRRRTWTSLVGMPTTSLPSSKSNPWSLALTASQTLITTI